ncbi:MAG: hypothetical protein ACOC5D_00695 [Thermoplasmatota archaeon]
MKLTDKEIKNIKKMRKDGLSLNQIADKLKKDEDEFKNYIIKEKLLSKELNEISLQSKAFKMFDEGKDAVDLVKEGYCTAAEAGVLMEKYSDLSEAEGQSEKIKDMHRKISTQVGLLGSRVARLEVKIMNSLLLPKTFECPSCGNKDKYEVGVVCNACGQVTTYIPDEIKDSLSGKIVDTSVYVGNTEEEED